MTSHQRRVEIAVLCVLLLASAGLLFWISPFAPTQAFVDVVAKFGLALMVGVVVRLATLFLTPPEIKGDMFATSKAEYETAIREARHSIWILQTWFPGLATYTALLLDRPDREFRIILSSFRRESHIRSRILGRQDINTDHTAMVNVWQCVRPFLLAGKSESLRFNYGHHPGWITVVDEKTVFWGPTPVHLDNHALDLFFHKDSVEGTWGAFWKAQFNLIWTSFSHDVDKEREYNSAFEAPETETEVAGG